MKEKILVVFTGGTIGSVIGDNVINVSENKKYILLDMYKKSNQEKNIIFDTISPINILSENETIEDWNKIVEAIKEKNLSEYKGIIIPHGTDTLGFFANAISYMLYKVKIPIVIVSSNLVLDNKNANGLVNFKTAVDFIINNNNNNGVFVTYRNNDGVVYIHKGTRVKQIQEITDNLYSVNNNYFAKIENENTVNYKIDKKSIREYEYEFVPKMEGILYIKPIVGQKYDFNIDNYRIIYHEMFHSGTIPKQAIDLIKKCKQKNKLFFMGVQKKEVESLYASTSEAIKAGAITLSNMSQEAAIIKLMMANGTFDNDEDLIDFMKNDIIGEMIDK